MVTFVTDRLRVLALPRYDREAASTRYRILQYAAPLAQQGIDVTSLPLFGDDYVRALANGRRTPWWHVVRDYAARLRALRRQAEFDCAFLYVELLPWLPYLFERGALHLPYLYDFDDAFFLRYEASTNALVKPALGGKIPAVIAAATAVSAGNDWLANYAGRFNASVTVLPTVVDTDRYRVCPAERAATFHIGWIGSPSTAPYLDAIRGPLARLGERTSITLTVIGGRIADIPGVTVRCLPWRESDEVRLINTFDVGIMPLPDDDWSRGKCAFKLIQYMACGVPVVASAVGANIAVVGQSGYLCRTPDDWFAAFEALLADTDRRREMGRAGRETVVARYSLAGHVETMASLLRRVAGRP